MSQRHNFNSWKLNKQLNNYKCIIFTLVTFSRGRFIHDLAITFIFDISYFKFQSQSNRTAELNTLQNTIGLHLLPEIRPRCRPVPTPTAGKTLKSVTARRLKRGKQNRQRRPIFRSRKPLKQTSEIWSDFTRADCLSRNSSEFTKYVNLMYLNKKIFKINWSTIQRLNFYDWSCTAI